MDEKYLSGLGTGLILVSFGIIISYLVPLGAENKAAEQNTTISFEQLDDSSSTICNRNRIGIS